MNAHKTVGDAYKTVSNDYKTVRNAIAATVGKSMSSDSLPSTVRESSSLTTYWSEST